jgi:hypothetical protein
MFSSCNNVTDLEPNDSEKIFAHYNAIFQETNGFFIIYNFKNALQKVSHAHFKNLVSSTLNHILGQISLNKHLNSSS